MKTILGLGLGLIFCLGNFHLRAQTLNEGMKAFEKQEYSKALQIFSALQINNPKDGASYYWMGKTYLELENPSQATQIFQKGITTLPKYGLNYVGAGKMNLLQKNTPEAKKQFDKALELTQSNNVEVLTDIADAWLADGSKEGLGEAEKLLIKAKTLDSKNVFVYTSLGDLYLRQKIDELALTNYRKSIALDPTFLIGYLRVGQLYVKNKQYNDGAAAFREAIAKDASFAPAYRELGELYYLSKKYEEAKNNYRKYVDLSGNDLAARARYASFLFLTEEYPAALSEIDNVLKDTTTLVMLRLKGYCLLKTGNGPEAQKVMDQYFKLIPPQYILGSDLEYYAKILEKNGQDSVAIGYYEQAILKDSTLITLKADIGTNYIRQKKYDKAAEVYEEIVTRTPGYKNYYDLGKAYYFMKAYDKAHIAFEKMTTLQPGVHLGYLWKGNALAKQEDQENPEGKAKPDFEKVVEIITTNNTIEKYKKDFITANSYLAAFYFIKEDKVNALKYATVVTGLEPEHPQCKQMVEYLNKK
jgi:tetratricopeptide (TPR) repeat protein